MVIYIAVALWISKKIVGEKNVFTSGKRENQTRGLRKI